MTNASKIGLCLSGGGYRAMLFHLGAIWRITEAGWLPRLKVISSVSGGSLTAGVLALNWDSVLLREDRIEGLKEHVVKPVRTLARCTLDTQVVSEAASAFYAFAFVRWGSAIFEKVTGRRASQSVKARIERYPGNRLANLYAEKCFKDATLQDLPVEPRFVFNATNVRTAHRFAFSNQGQGGRLFKGNPNPELPLAVAVAASSAFPPFLSPVLLDGEPLTDGGAFDNLGLDGLAAKLDGGIKDADKTMAVFVSDGGMCCGVKSEPWWDWISQTRRVMDIIDGQVRSFRQDAVRAALQKHGGAYWSISSGVDTFGGKSALNCPHDRTRGLAEEKTRLKNLHATTQERLINWGYAVADASIRTSFDLALPQPAGFPYKCGVG